MTIEDLIKDYEHSIQILRIENSTISELIATVYESVVKDLQQVPCILRQAPRVLTLDEVKSLPEETDVWLELSKIDGSIGTATTIAGHGEGGCCSHYDAFKYSDYNKTPYGWRLWTGRPSKEQMAEAKWDDAR